MLGSDLPPPYSALKEDASTEQNATEVTIPVSPDDPTIYGALFEHTDIRIRFILKVLFIKLVQAFAMTMVMMIFILSPYTIFWEIQFYRELHIKLIVTASLVLVGMLILIHYCEKARFVRPYNYMFLVAYPLSIAFFAIIVTFDWALTEIFMSWIYFNLVVFALLMYSIVALHTKIEFKTSVGMFIATGTLIASYALSISFIYDISCFGILYCSLAMFALTAYMLYDLQLMMSGTYRIRLAPSDFVKAALIMHIDYRYMLANFTKEAGNQDRT